jgi:RNA polymerase sigma-70 factor (ECF subfamily)
MSEVSDETIAEEVQHGDGERYGELISRYEAKLKRYARKFLNRQEDIDDLVQDVFVKAYTNLQSFDVDQRFSSWIYRIAHNTFVNELRRKDRQGFSVFDADTIFPFIAAKETADGEALAAEVEAEMDTLVETLPQKYREVILLHYFEHLSYQEISDVLRVPVNTVGVRMTRARVKLKQAYQANNERV